MVLDDEVKSAPVVIFVPLGPSFIIEGLDGYEDARDRAASLMIPLEFLHPESGGCWNLGRTPTASQNATKSLIVSNLLLTEVP